MIGPVALLNKPCSGSAPHVVLCSLPTVSALDRLKKRRRTVLQDVAEQQQQSGAEGRQCLQKQQQQQQHMHATRSSGEQSLSWEQVTAAEARSRADLTTAASKRKMWTTNRTLLPQDRLLPQMSVRLHSSYKSGCQRLNAGEEILLGYGRSYCAFK